MSHRRETVGTYDRRVPAALTVRRAVHLRAAKPVRLALAGADGVSRRWLMNNPG